MVKSFDPTTQTVHYGRMFKENLIRSSGGMGIVPIAARRSLRTDHAKSLSELMSSG